MRRTRRFPAVPAAVLLAALLLHAAAQAQLTARAVGMGGAYTALARGVHAPAWNPANLGLPDNPKVSFTFVSTGAMVWNNSFTKKFYDRYFVGDGDGGVEWTQQDVEDILGYIPDDGLGVDVGVDVRAFSFSVGRFAMTAGADAASYVKLKKSFFELALQGNEMFETYSLGGTEGRALGLGILRLSWGQPVSVPGFDAFAVGVNLNILYAAAYAEPAKAVFDVTTTPLGFDVVGEYEATATYNGEVGFGADLGVAAQFNDRWTVSLGIGNVLGSVPWSGEGETYHGTIEGTALTVFDIADEKESEDILSDSTWSHGIDPFSTRLPAVLRLGGSLELAEFLIAADYCQGLEEDAFTTTRPRFSVGAEWRGLPWLPLRMGFVFGGRMGYGTSFGLGIRPGGFVLDIGVVNGGFVTPGSSKGVAVAVELGIDIQRKREGVARIRDF